MKNRIRTIILESIRGVNPYKEFDTKYQLIAKYDFSAIYNPKAQGGSYSEIVLSNKAKDFFDVVKAI